MESLLNASGSVVLDVDGYGLCYTAPRGESWVIESITMQCSLIPGESLPGSEAQGRVYVGSNTPTFTYVKATTSAASTGDVAGGSTLRIPDGTPVLIEWSGGDAGVVGTYSLTGIRSTPQGGFRARDI